MPRRYTSARFVGREAEFARLAAALDGAADGLPTTVLVAADIGLGASRFLDEAWRASAAHGAVHADPLSGHRRRDGRPYGPRTEGLGPSSTRSRTASSPASPDRRPELARLLPALVPRLAASGLLPERPVISDVERRQPRFLEVVLGVLSRLAERHPVVIVLEDLHRVDPATRSLVAFLARVSRGQRVCLVATYQPDALDQGHPLHATLAAMAALATAARHDHAAAARSGRAGRPDRRHRGRASVGLGAAARRRAVVGQPARGRGAAGGPSGAVERVADRLARHPRDGAARPPLAGVPPRAAPPRAGGRPVDRASWRTSPPRSRGSRGRRPVRHRPASRRRHPRRRPRGRRHRGDRAWLPGRARRRPAPGADREAPAPPTRCLPTPGPPPRADRSRDRRGPAAAPAAAPPRGRRAGAADRPGSRAPRATGSRPTSRRRPERPRSPRPTRLAADRRAGRRPRRP